MGLMAFGFGCRLWDERWGVQVVGFRVWGLGFRVYGLEFRI